MFSKVTEFIRGLYNTDDFIPLHAPVFIGNEKKYLNDCIDSTFVSSVGKYVDEFEEMVCKYTGAKTSVVCVNGTSALHLALEAVGVGPNTEVITQPLTFIATANAISYCGATPVFIDVDKDTLGLSPEKLLQWLKSSATIKLNPTTNKPEAVNNSTNRVISACLPMHTFGHPCRIDEIVDICNSYHIPVVEDAAESLGSFYKGTHTGIFGKIGVLSFNGNKTITTGGGGMILTDDEELGKHLKHLTTQAKVPFTWEYVHDFVGYNYRMPNINAALGVAQIENIDLYIKNKRETAEKYSEFFNSIGIAFIKEPAHAHSNYWLNSIVLKNRNQRDEFLKYTNDQGVMTRPVWRLMNKLEMFKNCQTGDLSNAVWFEDRVVNIPSSFVLK
ncbi:MAG: aminotransferase DegT [Bacteroidetes bacterium 4484_276]|nr:MAG: aminotransferase DegT [Bacteroidetes bacterium 4484_276]